MNRPIKFRGKRIDDGTWVYGSYQADVMCLNKHTIIYSDNEGFYSEDEVIPETVGQFTGLHDRDGKEIYEGDIVESSHRIHDGGKSRLNKVKFKDYCWRIVAIGDKQVADAPLSLYAREPEYIVVISNIY